MDRRIRELLLAWQSSGEVEAKLAYLQARVRAQDMEPEHLEAAIWLGDPEAQLVARGVLPAQVLGRRAPKTGVTKLLWGLPGGDEVDARALATVLDWHLGETGSAVDRERLNAVLAHAESNSDTSRLVAAVAVSQAREGRDPAFGRALDALYRCLEGSEEDEEGGLFLGYHALTEGLPVAKQRDLRDRVQAALLPWVLTLEGAGAEWEERPEDRIPLFTADVMTREVARRVLDLGHLRPLSRGTARSLLATYLEAIGWSQRRGAFYSPGLPLRVLLKARSIRVEERSSDRWRRAAPFAGNVVDLQGMAETVLDQALSAR